jgi:hypothetical protein
MTIVCWLCKRVVGKAGAFTEDGRYVCGDCWLDNPPEDPE